MGDIYEQDKLRILGPLQRDAAIVQRVQTDAAMRAAQAIEAERQADARSREAALAHEAELILEASRAAVEKLAALKPLYAQRQQMADKVITAIAELWKVEQDIRAGLSDADRIAAEVEYKIEPTQRARWRSSLRDRAGLPTQHAFAPDVKLDNDSQRIGAVAVAALTSGIILPGRIETPRGDVINFDFA